MMRTIREGQSAVTRLTQTLQFICSKTRIASPARTEAGLYFRKECEACRPQRPSTPLKSMVHLARNPLDQNQ